MATEHIKQALSDGADALGDAKDAVVDTAKDVHDDREKHDDTVGTVQDSLELRAAERKASQERAEG